MAEEIYGLSKQSADKLRAMARQYDNRDLSNPAPSKRGGGFFLEQWLGIVTIPESDDYTDERYYVRRADLEAVGTDERITVAALDEDNDHYLEVTATHLSEYIGNSFTTQTSHLIANGTPVIVRTLFDAYGVKHYFFDTTWPSPGTTDLTYIAWTDKKPILDTPEECEEDPDTTAHTDQANNFTQPQTVTNSATSQNVAVGGPDAAVKTTAANAGQNHAIFQTGDSQVAGVNGNGQYVFLGTSSSGQSVYDFSGPNAAANRVATRADLGLGSVATLNATTSVGNPGSDTLIPTEKAVRAAIAAGGGGTANGFAPQSSGTAGLTVPAGFALVTGPEFEIEEDLVLEGDMILV